MFLTFGFDLGKQIYVSIGHINMFSVHIVDVNGFKATDVNDED